MIGCNLLGPRVHDGDEYAAARRGNERITHTARVGFFMATDTSGTKKWAVGANRVLTRPQVSATGDLGLQRAGTGSHRQQQRDLLERQFGRKKKRSATHLCNFKVRAQHTGLVRPGTPEMFV